jgi:hypothetical protein
MNRLIARPLLMLSASGLALAVAAAPVKVSAAEATEVDEDVVAAQLCGADATFLDADSDEDGDRADVTVLTYETTATDGLAGAPAELCTFAIISTDDDTTLDGSYALSVGAAGTSGAVPRTGGATAAVHSTAGQSPTAVFASAGHRTTVDVTKASAAARKKAKKALAATRKKAKKAYVTSGRTAAAKKALKRKNVAAAKRYRAAVAPRTTVSTAGFRLDVTLALDAGSLDDQP